MLIITRKTLRTAVLTVSLMGAISLTQAAPSTVHSISGYVKFDTIFDQENDGGNDQALVKLSGDEASDEEGDINLASVESRIKIQSLTTGTPMGLTKSVIEADFFSGGKFGLRHAYFTNKGLTFGQTWSTFMDLSALPEKVDFGGAAARIFSRKSLVKYSLPVAGGIADLALEAPIYSVNEEQDAATPDIIAKYTHNSFFGYLSGGVLIQNINVDNTTTDQDTSTPGDQLGTLNKSKMAVAARFSGRINMGKDNLKFALIAGQGLGSYINFGDTETGSISASGTSIDLSDTVATRISFQHFWSPTLRSTLVYGKTTADIAGVDSGDYQSTHANLIYAPYKTHKFGGEFINASKVNQNNLDGSKNSDSKLNRIQFFAKYAF